MPISFLESEQQDLQPMTRLVVEETAYSPIDTEMPLALKQAWAALQTEQRVHSEQREVLLSKYSKSTHETAEKPSSPAEEMQKRLLISSATYRVLDTRLEDGAVVIDARALERELPEIPEADKADVLHDLQRKVGKVATQDRVNKFEKDTVYAISSNLKDIILNGLGLAHSADQHDDLHIGMNIIVIALAYRYSLYTQNPPEQFIDFIKNLSSSAEHAQQALAAILELLAIDPIDFSDRITKWHTEASQKTSDKSHTRSDLIQFIAGDSRLLFEWDRRDSERGIYELASEMGGSNRLFDEILDSEMARDLL